MAVRLNRITLVVCGGTVTVRRTVWSGCSMKVNVAGLPLVEVTRTVTATLPPVFGSRDEGWTTRARCN